MTNWEIDRIGGKGTINVLMIEDDKGFARLIEEMIEKMGKSIFNFKHVDNLNEGLSILSKEDIDVVLLDLLLPDSEGLFTFLKTFNAVPDVPIVVLSSLEDDETAILAIREGAQDYIYKGFVNKNVLIRSIRHSVERKRSWKILSAARDILESVVEEKNAKVDELTMKLKDSEEKREKLEIQLKKS